MPLNVAVLYEPLLKLCLEGSLTPENSAEKMTQSYIDYTSAATFPPDIPVFTGLEKAILKATILAVLNPALMNPAGLATAWTTGIQAFWLSPPIICAGPWPGSVALIPGISSVFPVIQAACLVPFQPADVFAAAVSGAIHAATSTVQASLTPPGGSPVLVPIV